MKKSLPGRDLSGSLPPPPCFVYQTMGVRLSATHSEVCVDHKCFKSYSLTLCDVLVWDTVLSTGLLLAHESFSLLLLVEGRGCRMLPHSRP